MSNAEQVISRGASSSSRSVVGEGTAADDEEVTVTTEEEVVRSGTLLELDLLDCPVCCHALTTPIFQCDNGHIACSSCCTKLRNRCPSCTLPIGVYRNRMMERVVEAIIVPCPNAKHGCTDKFSYGKELVHEKECSFALCYCPAPHCNYSGLYIDLYRHYYANHSCPWEYFRCGYDGQAWMHISDEILVLQEGREGPLVAIQCFEEEQGVYVTVNCITPCSPGVSEFSFQLSYSAYGNAARSMSFGMGEMNRIQKFEDEYLHPPKRRRRRRRKENMMRRLKLLTKFSGEEEEGTRKEYDCMKFNMLLDCV
ncbi:E3 ubiquitin-protein ligase SINA-like 2 [Raphanus sativus]|nr:E3 ubiquitin-protein ligase SINA-like 2 [Raphanus sativus]